MRKLVLVPLVLLLAASAADVHAASLILNEWNAVSATNFLGGASSTNSDTFFGRIAGNGGDWVELVVIDDHLDVRGWQLDWFNTDSPVESGLVTFSSSSVWSNLRSGTIITIRRDDAGFAAMPSDTSFNPSGGDWWIHVNVADVSLVTSTTSPVGTPFTVDNDNWRMRIRDDSSVLVQGYVGEGQVATGWTGGGLGSDEVGKLEQNPSAIPSNYRDGSSSTFGAPNRWTTASVPFEQDFTLLRAAVPEPSSIVLACLGFVGVGVAGYRKRRV